MAERYLVIPDVPEQLKLKKETNEKLAEEKGCRGGSEKEAPKRNERRVESEANEV